MSDPYQDHLDEQACAAWADLCNGTAAWEDVEDVIHLAIFTAMSERMT